MESHLGVRKGEKNIAAAWRGERRWPRPSERAALLGAILLGLVVISVLGPRDPIWRPLGHDAPAAAHLDRMEEALAQQDLRGARREWDHAYSSALTTGDWKGMVGVGEAYVRLGERTGQRDEAGATARGILQIAFTRAQREGSPEGVLRAAEALADLGEFALADLSLGVARGLAGGHADPQIQARMHLLRARLVSQWVIGGAL